MPMSNYLKQRVINAALARQAFPSISNVFVGLFTTNPGDDGTTGTEVTGGGYARKQVIFGAPSFTGGTASAVNTTEVDFGIATADWRTITHAALFDAVASGNMLYHSALSSAKIIEKDDSLRFAVGKLTASQS